MGSHLDYTPDWVGDLATPARCQVLHQKHWEELERSNIDIELAHNFSTLADEVSICETVFGDNPQYRKNTGNLNAGAARRLKEYTENPGWYCDGGFDPFIKNYKEEQGDWGQEWGCYKPGTPLEYFDYKANKQKSVKYIHQKGKPTRAFLLDPGGFGAKILAKYGATWEGRDPSRDFWRIVINNPNIPLYLTEGAKKAASLMSQGFAAIGVPGIWNARRQPKDKNGLPCGQSFLIPEIAVFYLKNREVIFAFDQDHPEKRKTRIAVYKAITATAKLFNQAGARVKVATWNYKEGKGIDDVSYNQGGDRVKEIMENAIPIHKLSTLSDSSFDADERIHQRFWGEDAIAKHVPPKGTGKLIFVKGAHGTGKTFSIKNIIGKWQNEGIPTDVFVPRLALGKEIAYQFGITDRREYRSDDLKGVLGVASCINSLHPRANPPYRAAEKIGHNIFFDEFTQQLKLLLTSSICEKNRRLILKEFRRLLIKIYQNGGVIIFSDADLTNKEVEFVLSIFREMGIENPDLIRLENTYKPAKEQGRVLHLVDGAEKDLVAIADEKVAKGEKIIIFTDQQKTRGTWGTQTFEHYYKTKKEAKVLRVDRDTVSDPKHEAYHCIENFTEVIKDYQVVVCSPVLETGVSLNTNYFDAVFVVSHGVQTINSVIQAAQRVRSDAPRYLWSQTSGKKLQVFDTNYREVLNSTRKWGIKIKNLIQPLGDFEDEYLDDDTVSPSLLLWAKYVAETNAGAERFKENLVFGFQNYGYTVKTTLTPDDDKSKVIKKEFKEIKDANFNQYCTDVSEAENVSGKTEREVLKEKRELTKEERDKKAKDNIRQGYGLEEETNTLEVTPELVAAHEKGFYSQLRLHYYFENVRENMLNIVKESPSPIDLEDVKQRVEVVQKGVVDSLLPYYYERRRRKLSQESGDLWLPDLAGKPPISLKIEMLLSLGIDRFISYGGELAEIDNDELEEWFTAYLTKNNRLAIRQHFGVTITEGCTAIACLNRLLKCLGLKCARWGRRQVNGERKYIYLQANTKDMRQTIFLNWLTREYREIAEMTVEKVV